MQDKILRPRTVVKMVGLSRSTLWRLENEGLFPARRKISRMAIGWLESEVLKWMADREKVKEPDL
jgi:prophage regulatory protein